MTHTGLTQKIQIRFSALWTMHRLTFYLICTSLVTLFWHLLLSISFVAVYKILPLQELFVITIQWWYILESKNLHFTSPTWRTLFTPSKNPESTAKKQHNNFIPMTTQKLVLEFWRHFPLYVALVFASSHPIFKSKQLVKNIKRKMLQRLQQRQTAYF